jgi:predicted dehydrogenase
MSKLRWGVLSTAKIGLDMVVPAIQMSKNCEVVAIASRAIQMSKNCEVVAIASRVLEKAELAARKLGVGAAYGSYEQLLADPRVDAIYNPLPNHLHVPWSIRAIDSNKHVLCEKPIALNVEEATQLFEAVRRRPELKVMEAFMYRFHPQWETICDILSAGDIGELSTIYSTFTYHNVNADDYRNVPEFGGGGLLDIGCYSISSSRWLFGLEPKRVFGFVQYDPTFGIDRLVSAVLDFGAGTATFTCATQIPRYQRMDVYGKEGRIVIEHPFNPPLNAPAYAWLHAAGQSRELASPAANQYTEMAEAFAAAALAGSEVPTPLEDALANMRVIDAVFESGETGSWVKL